MSQMYQKDFKHYVIRQAIVFVAPIITIMGALIVFGNVHILEFFQVLFDNNGSIFLFCLGLYVVVWLIENLIFIGFRFITGNEFSPRTRFWGQLLLTLLTVVFFMVWFVGSAISSV